MRISRTINENVPEHFLCFGTFFSWRFLQGILCVKTDTKISPLFLAFYDPAHEVPKSENLHGVLSQFPRVKRALNP